MFPEESGEILWGQVECIGQVRQGKIVRVVQIYVFGDPAHPLRIAA